MMLTRRHFVTGACAAAGAVLWPQAMQADTTLLPGLTANEPIDLAEAAPRPNIILMMSDDQGWGDTGYYGGGVQTPNLDAMAANGLRLDRMYAAAPVCSPTRASILTGRHPNRYGCYSWNYSMPESETTLAELLKGVGYVTGHFGKWHVGNVAMGAGRTPTNHGFDESLSHHHHFDADPVLYREGTAEQMYGEDSAIVADAAIDFMRRQAAAEQPFLAVVWFSDAHSPHITDQADRVPYAEEIPELGSYYGEITTMDRAVGRIRDELAALGIHEDTLLWFCSDNGGREWLGDNGGRGGKGQIWEGGLRVPGIIEWPGRVAAGRYSDAPVTTLDILPTVLDFVGVPAPDNLDGVSVRPLIDGEAFIHPPIGFWRFVSDEPNPVEPPASADAGHTAWLDWPWKLHKVRHDDGITGDALYNLLADPYEAQNLYRRESVRPRVKAMRQALETWQASVVAEMRTVSPEMYYRGGEDAD